MTTLSRKQLEMILWAMNSSEKSSTINESMIVDNPEWKNLKHVMELALEMTKPVPMNT